jgi:hypothetical protein
MSGWISPYTSAQLVELEKAARERKLAVEIDATTPLRYCTGDEPIVYASDTYSPKAFEVRGAEVGREAAIVFEGASADLVAAKFSEGSFGGLAIEVHHFLLQDDDTWLFVGTRAWIARFCTWSPEYFMIRLKEDTRVRRRKANAIVKAHCDLEFKGTLCQYVGVDTRCLKTWDDCKSKSNTQFFRGARFAPPPDYRLTIQLDELITVWVPAPLSYGPDPSPPVEPPPWVLGDRRRRGGRRHVPGTEGLPPPRSGGGRHGTAESGGTRGPRRHGSGD